MEAKLLAELDDQTYPLSGERPSVEPPHVVPSEPVLARTPGRSFAAEKVFASEPVSNEPVADVEPRVEVAAVAVAAERVSLPPQEMLVGASKAIPSSPSAGSAGQSRWKRWFGPLAVAAAVGAVWMSYGHLPSESKSASVVAEPIDTNAVPFAPGMNGARDLNALHAGDIVEAAVGPVEFGQAGAMRWTLSAGSRLTVLEGLQSGTHVVELESGSMRGSIAPGASIPLVISAGDTEVVSLGAGAIFSVTRSSKRVVMHLEEGSASVGQRGRRSEGRMFMAPLVAAFSLDGGSAFELLPTEKVAVDAPSFDPASTSADGTDVLAPRRVARAADDESIREVEPPSTESPRTQRLPSSTRVEPKVTNGPTASNEKSIAKDRSNDGKAEPGTVDPKSEPRLSDAALSSTVISCIERLRSERQAKAADGVRVLVDSVLTVRVSDDGSAQGVVFNPPLEPSLQSCAVMAYRSKLDPGARSVKVPISLH